MPDPRAPGVNPLTEQDLERLNTAQRQLDELEGQISLAEQAGFDVAPQREQATRYRTQIQRIKQAYFPNR